MTLSSSSRRAAPRRAGGRRRGVAVLQPRRGTARPGCGRPRGPPSRGSGSPGRCERSKRSRSASAPSRRPPRDGPRSGRPSPAGVVSTWLRLPRRSGSEASSVVCRRTATNASWSGARERACACTLPVATQGRRAGGASASRRAVARAVVALEGALELDPEPVGAERRRAGGAASARRARPAARSRSGRRAPRRAPRARPRARRAAATAARRASRACARARASGSRHRFDQPRASSTSSVRCAAVGEVDLRPVDRPQPERARGHGELHRPETRVVVGQRERLVAELARGRGRARRAARRRRGTRTPSGSGARRTHRTYVRKIRGRTNPRLTSY